MDDEESMTEEMSAIYPLIAAALNPIFGNVSTQAFVNTLCSYAARIAVAMAASDALVSTMMAAVDRVSERN